MRLKLFASDLDGTLLNEYGKISEESAEAIRKAQKSGRIFLVATGRNWKSVHSILQEAGVTCGAVLLNGAEYRDANGKILSCKTIADRTAQRIASMLMHEGIFFEMHTGSGDFVFRAAGRTNGETRHSPCAMERKKEGVRKFFIRSDDPLLLERLRCELGTIKGINLTSSAADNVEVVSDKADKGSMLEEAAARYGISQSEVAVFGDGENDLPLMSRFPHSFAVANADDRVKKTAETIIESNREDGVARQIRRLLMYYSFQPLKLLK